MIEKLDFSKVTKEHLPYTIFLNSVIQQIRNAETLAIWVYLYSLPPDWSVNKEHLKNKFNLGNRKLRKIFSYLHRAGLLEYHQERNSDGTLGVLKIHILCGTKFNADELFETVGLEIDSAASPVGQKTAPPVDRACGSETLQKKHIYKIKEKEKRKEEIPTLGVNAELPPQPINSQKNCPHDEIIKIYHQVLTMCRPVRVWNRTRQGYLKQRWTEEEKHQTLDFWQKYFAYVKGSPFLTGQIPGRNGKPPFIADLEWLIKPNNFAKVIEGKYHEVGNGH